MENSLPTYAGNLDIMTSSAVHLSIQYMIKNKLIISDVTLRDGNHAVNHSISREIIKKYCRSRKANIKIIEVGHGNGLGASSLSIGKSLITDEVALTTARKP